MNTFYYIFATDEPRLSAFSRYDCVEEIAMKLAHLLHDFDPTAEQIEDLGSSLGSLAFGRVVDFGGHKVVRLFEVPE